MKPRVLTYLDFCAKAGAHSRRCHETENTKDLMELLQQQKIKTNAVIRYF